jgi:UDP-N-acetyl-D-mannosaminuronic acid transferase (WecB/TagA/CpsF family)
VRNSVIVLGIPISSVSIPEAVDSASAGGLILAPSGPGLCDLVRDFHYREALLHADMNLPDSGLMILLTRILGICCLPRTSGLGFLETLLERPQLREIGTTFWVMPSQESAERNQAWLNARQIFINESNYYVAPVYPRQGPIADDALLARINKNKPKTIFICTGSGSQEKLGFWLKQNIHWNPAICCIGAAIGFLSGDQARIPSWTDRMCLGWLLRCLYDPGKFIPRYAKATLLIWLMLRYRDQAPPIKSPLARNFSRK